MGTWRAVSSAETTAWRRRAETMPSCEYERVSVAMLRPYALMQPIWPG